MEVDVLANSLSKALLLPDDMRFWEDCKDEDVILNLKWHSIVVNIPYLYYCIRSVTLTVFCLVLSFLIFLCPKHTDDPCPRGSVEECHGGY